MGFRGWLALVGLVALGWWFSPLSPRSQRVAEVRAIASPGASSSPSATATSANPLCPLPAGVRAGEPPLQGRVPDRFPQLAIEDARLHPLAGFSIDARVLSRKDYTSGREARYSPIDLALGWGRMADTAILSRLTITQSARWYHYRWPHDPPIPPGEMASSSANMHMIPANAAVAAALRRIDRGQHVRLQGWLVEVQAADGWRWRSSLTRDDSGAGSCEIIYVCDALTL